MDNQEMVKGAHMTMRTLKEHWWTDHDEPDPPPALYIQWRDRDPVPVDCGLMGSMIHRMREKYPKHMAQAFGLPVDEEPTGAWLLHMTLAALSDGVPLPGGHGHSSIVQAPKGTPMERIMFNVEGWARDINLEAGGPITSVDEAIERAGDEFPHEPGDLQRDFETNPASNVRETMTTYIVQTDPLGNAEWCRATAFFHKDDGGVIVWDEPRIDDSEHPVDGFDPLIDVMCHYVQRENLS